MSEVQFLAKFGSRFPAGKAGLTDTGLICELARDMQLAIGVCCYRDFDLVARSHTDPATNGILVCVERMLLAGTMQVLYHCMMLDRIDTSSFTLWTPIQDGTETVLPTFARSDWDAMLCHALVLRR